MPRVVASIEARMGSSRLPGKVLMPIGGIPAVELLVRRLRRCEAIDGIVLATSTSKADDALAAWADEAKVPVFRGSEQDVLGRVVGAHRQEGSDIVVELTGDCPFTDPEVVDLGVRTFLANDADVVSTTWKPSYPMGIDVQVFRRAALEEVARTVHDPAVREHVSLHFYEHPEQYRILHLTAPARWRDPEARLVLDYPGDLALLRAVHQRLAPVHGDAYGTADILGLLRREPTLRDLNRDCEERPVR